MKRKFHVRCESGEKVEITSKSYLSIYDFDHGGKSIEMPIKYKKEMLCDFLGAGRAYYGKDFSYPKEYDFWIDRKSKPMAMHPNDTNFITKYLSLLATQDDDKYVFSLLRKE